MSLPSDIRKVSKTISLGNIEVESVLTVIIASSPGPRTEPLQKTTHEKRVLNADRGLKKKNKKDILLIVYTQSLF